MKPSIYLCICLSVFLIHAFKFSELKKEQVSVVEDRFGAGPCWPPGQGLRQDLRPRLRALRALEDVHLSRDAGASASPRFFYWAHVGFCGVRSMGSFFVFGVQWVYTDSRLGVQMKGSWYGLCSERAWGNVSHSQSPCGGIPYVNIMDGMAICMMDIGFCKRIIYSMGPTD